jgi:hypothetical protein
MGIALIEATKFWPHSPQPCEIKIQNARKSAAHGERDRKRLRAAALDHAA